MDVHQSYQSLVYLSIGHIRRTSVLLRLPMEDTSWLVVRIITIFVTNIRLLNGNSLQLVLLCSVRVVEQVKKLHWLMWT